MGQGKRRLCSRGPLGLGRMLGCVYLSWSLEFSATQVATRQAFQCASKILWKTPGNQASDNMETIYVTSWLSKHHNQPFHFEMAERAFQYFTKGKSGKAALPL